MHILWQSKMLFVCLFVLCKINIDVFRRTFSTDLDRSFPCIQEVTSFLLAACLLPFPLHTLTLGSLKQLRK